METTLIQQMESMKTDNEAIALLRDAMLKHFADDSKFQDEAMGILRPIGANFNAVGKLGRWFMLVLGFLALIATIFGGFGWRLPIKMP